MRGEPLTMQEIQSISLEILKTVATICEEHNFRYTLAYGTLIGAIRHNGFIPWDDDIDIQMPRPDYEAFLQYMHDHPINSLKVYNYKWIKNYPLGISRIADMRFPLYEEKFHHKDMGVFLDVYPIDGLANTYESAKDAYRDSDEMRSRLLFGGVKTRFQVRNRGFVDTIKIYLSKAKLRLSGLNKIQRKLTQLCMSRNFSDFEYVGIPNWNWIDLRYKREWFESFVKHKFEDSEFYITKYYDEVLRAEFGDYMKLPPVEKRIMHHDYVAYRES